MAIKRVWHGWTTLENADAYQSLLFSEIIPGIKAKQIPGYRGIEVLRQEHEHEVEFITIMMFDALQNVIDFQGADYQKAYVPEKAQAVLSRWDAKSAHYEVVDAIIYE